MRTRPPLLLLGGLLLAGCAAAPAAPADAPSWTFAVRSTPAVASLTVIDVYKSPTCSCCHEWEAYLRARGYTVNSIPVEDLARVKADHGIPGSAQSCHTAVVGGYVVEGHVPVEAIEDLLADAPAIDGIALPGMPAGSPGMPGDKAAPFEILALDGGDTSAFGSY
jgi:hypothetical protein